MAKQTEPINPRNADLLEVMQKLKAIHQDVNTVRSWLNRHVHYNSLDVDPAMLDIAESSLEVLLVQVKLTLKTVEQLKV
jgi:hypothetical protein